MGRRRKAPPATTLTQPVLAIEPGHIYRPMQITEALGLSASTLRREWREGRLRVCRRCNRNFLLGKDILAWLDHELPRRACKTTETPAA